MTAVKRAMAENVQDTCDAFRSLMMALNMTSKMRCAMLNLNQTQRKIATNRSADQSGLLNRLAQ